MAKLKGYKIHIPPKATTFNLVAKTKKGAMRAALATLRHYITLKEL